MCRRNVFLGGLLIAFGAGLLFGFWVKGGFFCHIFAIGMIIGGSCVCKRH